MPVSGTDAAQMTGHRWLAVSRTGTISLAAETPLVRLLDRRPLKWKNTHRSIVVDESWYGTRPILMTSLEKQRDETMSRFELDCWRDDLVCFRRPG